MPTTTIFARRPSARALRSRSPSLLFLRQFVRDPGNVASLVGSSRWLVDHMLATIDWTQTRLIVEYGPGVGAFVPSILARLRPDACYLAIDSNAAFVRYLRANVSDPRFTVVNGSAADVEQIVRMHRLGPADHVLSGLPFSTLPPGAGSAIVAATRRTLRSGGSMLVYQVSSRVRPLLAAEFARVEQTIEWRNLPPMRCYRARD